MEERFDTIVIGGGITGAAVARELAANGVSTALFEAGDFGSGTTSKTSKLQYCGLAYLADFSSLRRIFRHPLQFLGLLRLARRSMVERRRFLAASPHRLKRIQFQIPVFADEGPSRLKMSLAMRLMAALDPASPFEWHNLDAAEAAQLPFLARTGKRLAGAITYFDYQYYWPERVCLDVILQAEASGAQVRNYCPVRSMSKDGKDWRVEIEDLRSGQTKFLHTTTIVNCAGPWVDKLPERSGIKIETLNSGEKGANIMMRLPPHYRGKGMQVKTERDGAFYIIPWDDLHYVGPVNTVLDVEDADSSRATPFDRERLLALFERYFAPEEIAQCEVVFSWAGTRPRTRDPVSGSPAATPKLHGPKTTGHDGYFAYTGGLLMMQQAIGEEAARGVMASLGRRWTASSSNLELPNTTEGCLDRDAVAAMVKTEHARELDDILFRRTARGWSEDLGLPVLSQVAEWLGDALGWSSTERSQAKQRYHDFIGRNFRT